MSLLKSRKEIDIAIKTYSLISKVIICAMAFSSFSCMNRSQRNNASFNTKLDINSCLEQVKINDLKKVLKLCNEVIDQFPNNPEPLINRSLIYTLKGEQDLACLDVKTAFIKLKESGDKIDPLIKYQIQVRHDSCAKL